MYDLLRLRLNFKGFVDRERIVARREEESARRNKTAVPTEPTHWSDEDGKRIVPEVSGRE